MGFGCGRMPCDCGFVVVFRVNPCVGCDWVVVMLNGDGCCVSGIEDGGGIVVVLRWFQLFAENGSVSVCSIVSCKCRYVFG